MKLAIKVIAFSEEHGLKSTKAEIVEIPVKVVRLNEVIMGSDIEGILDGFAVSALVAALQTVQAGAQRGPAAGVLGGDTGGAPIGGSGRQPVEEGGGGRKHEPLATALGLDLIEAMDAKDARTRPAPGPGPIGFGPHRQAR